MSPRPCLGQPGSAASQRDRRRPFTGGSAPLGTWARRSGAGHSASPGRTPGRPRLRRRWASAARGPRWPTASGFSAGAKPGEGGHVGARDVAAGGEVGNLRSAGLSGDGVAGDAGASPPCRLGRPAPSSPSARTKPETTAPDGMAAGRSGSTVPSGAMVARTRRGATNTPPVATVLIMSSTCWAVTASS